MRQKRTMCLILTLVLALATCGCGEPEPEMALLPTLGPTTAGVTLSATPVPSEVPTASPTEPPAPASPVPTVAYPVVSSTPSHTPVPPTPTAPPPTATGTPTLTPLPTHTPWPTNTPAPTDTPLPMPTAMPPPARITFAPGATSANTTGDLPGHGVDRYVLRALAGQMMDVHVAAPAGTARLIVYGVDGTVLKSGMGGPPSYRGVLPSTQDYVLEVAAGPAAVHYGLSVVIPQRISFRSGATSAYVEGNLAAHRGRHYVLRALAGQLMEVGASAPAGTVRLIIYGADGTVLKSGMGGPPSYRGLLPATQDYIIQLAAGPAAVHYGLNVVVPQRVSFWPGTTSASLEGSLAAHKVRHYVLRASGGQTMEASVLTVAGEVRLIIYGADGTVLKSGMGGPPTFLGILPTSQDYVLQVAAGPDAVSYTLQVRIE